MADENLINPSGTQESNPAQDRIKQLSANVETTAKERDELKGLRDKDQQKIAELERENSFNTGYADMLGNYPTAREHKDDIKTKVMAGYTVEDATLAVLGKAGKLGGSAPAPQVAGGSSDTTIQTTTKETKDMTQAERRAELDKALLWQ